MAIVAMPLTSCDKDDEPKPNDERQHDPTSDDDQVAIAAYDALEWLQGYTGIERGNGYTGFQFGVLYNHSLYIVCPLDYL